ncbi:hypothetical protein DPEC_G00099460 [Dallia pectoralis]|uniref:Uncharacterized protein n=1 Tax=Dallia pectoralis TaxID=75939 RepID=A0ACC2GW68_DALPE|nr:hypothetical protein DPEC_G00099460 [Dallia pectoralis]
MFISSSVETGRKVSPNKAGLFFACLSHLHWLRNYIKLQEIRTSIQAKTQRCTRPLKLKKNYNCSRLIVVPSETRAFGAETTQLNYRHQLQDKEKSKFLLTQPIVKTIMKPRGVLIGFFLITGILYMTEGQLALGVPSLRCKCPKFVESLNPDLIVACTRYSPRPHCPKAEIIVTLKGRKKEKACLDPNGNFVKGLYNGKHKNKMC